MPLIQATIAIIMLYIDHTMLQISPKYAPHNCKGLPTSLLLLLWTADPPTSTPTPHQPSTPGTASSGQPWVDTRGRAACVSGPVSGSWRHPSWHVHRRRGCHWVLSRKAHFWRLSGSQGIASPEVHRVWLQATSGHLDRKQIVFCFILYYATQTLSLCHIIYHGIDIPKF